MLPWYDDDGLERVCQGLDRGYRGVERRHADVLAPGAQLGRLDELGRHVEHEAHARRQLPVLHAPAEIQAAHDLVPRLFVAEHAHEVPGELGGAEVRHEQQRDLPRQGAVRLLAQHLGTEPDVAEAHHHQAEGRPDEDPGDAAVATGERREQDRETQERHPHGEVHRESRPDRRELADLGSREGCQAFHNEGFIDLGGVSAKSARACFGCTASTRWVHHTQCEITLTNTPYQSVQLSDSAMACFVSGVSRDTISENGSLAPRISADFPAPQPRA